MAQIPQGPGPSLPPPSSRDDLLTLYDLSIDPKTHQVSLKQPPPSDPQVISDLASTLATINELSGFLVRGPYPHCPPLGPPPPPHPAATSAPNPRAVQINKLKTDGNLFFNRGDFPRAIEAYTRAADVSASRPLFEHSAWVREELAVLLCNRCAAFLSMKKFGEALADAEAVIELKKNWSKGHFRKSKVLQGMGKWEDALDAALLGLEFEPDNKELLTLVDEAKEGLRKKGASLPAAARRNPSAPSIAATPAATESSTPAASTTAKEESPAPSTTDAPAKTDGADSGETATPPTSSKAGSQQKTPAKPPGMGQRAPGSGKTPKKRKGKK